MLIVLLGGILGRYEPLAEYQIHRARIDQGPMHTYESYYDIVRVQKTR